MKIRNDATPKTDLPRFLLEGAAGGLVVLVATVGFGLLAHHFGASVNMAKIGTGASIAALSTAVGWPIVRGFVATGQDLRTFRRDERQRAQNTSDWARENIHHTPPPSEDDELYADLDAIMSGDPTRAQDDDTPSVEKKSTATQAATDWEAMAIRSLQRSFPKERLGELEQLVRDGIKKPQLPYEIAINRLHDAYKAKKSEIGTVADQIEAAVKARPEVERSTALSESEAELQNRAELALTTILKAPIWQMTSEQPLPSRSDMIKAALQAELTGGRSQVHFYPNNTASIWFNYLAQTIYNKHVERHPGVDTLSRRINVVCAKAAEIERGLIAAS